MNVSNHERMNRLCRLSKQLRWLLATLFLIGFSIAVYAPEDVLNRSSLLTSFTSTMRRLVPYIDGAVMRSSFPQVTALYFSLTWLVSPLFLPYEWIRFHANNDQESKKFRENLMRQPTRLLWVRNSFLLLFLMIIWIGMLVWYDGSDFKVAPFNDNRIALGLVGWLFGGYWCFSAGFALAVIVANHMRWITIFRKGGLK